MKRLKIIAMVLFTAVTSCKTASQPAIDNDLAKMDAPQGTKELVEETMIYKYTTNELKPRSTSTMTFNDQGNFLTHVQSFPDGAENKQEYFYDETGRLLKIVAASSKYGVSTTTYSYEGKNPLTITTAVEGGKNYVPKIIQYFNGDKKVKEEIFNNEGILRERITYEVDTQTTTSFTNSGAFSAKRVKTFKNGSEIKSITYNEDGSVYRGIENELDKYGNMIRSWILDKDLKRERESIGYYYTYINDTWLLRVGREIRDYGSGATANLTVRTVKGKINASISIDEVKAALKTIKI